MNQVERVADEVSTADMAGRMDLRDWQTVTIDGEDAKDLGRCHHPDERGGYLSAWAFILRMSSNYVQERSALDVEASKARNIGVSCRPRDSDASACAVKRHLFAECRERTGWH